MSQVNKYDETIIELIRSVKAALTTDESNDRRNHVCTYIVERLQQFMLDIRKDMKELKNLKEEINNTVRVVQVDSRKRNDEYPDSLTF